MIIDLWQASQHYSLPDSCLPNSILLLCPWCGNCWCRISGHDPTFWQQRFIPCHNHAAAAFAYGRDFGGSLLELGEDLLDKLPSELLKREFYLHLAQQEAS
jgi:hypothetical protein